ncbi:MAG: sulfurtransferase TusA family protein [Beijerinckiaceae bacterium]|jgi:TusA-related sulfurtransferase|nr:sulfurtransferase TusA family protein [Beijerinckiaceae bacterium]
MADCETIDLTGLFCPQVVLALARRVRGAPPGHRVIVLSTDPLSAIDIPVFAMRNRFELVGQASDAETRTFTLLKLSE